MSTPADGATVSVPTLTWEPSADAAQYKVTVTGPAGSDELDHDVHLVHTPEEADVG